MLQCSVAGGDHRLQHVGSAGWLDDQRERKLGFAVRRRTLPNCDRPVVMACVRCGEEVLKRCRASSSRRCGPCGESYRRNVTMIGASGNAGIMLTLTAPGDHQHGYRGWTCPCTPVGGVDIGRWNGEAGHHWNRLHQALERAHGCKLMYFRATEVQERGALHFHVLIRPERPVSMKLSKVRRLAMEHGFGHEVDVEVVRNERAAGYCAKYVSKAADEREQVPYVHRVTGEIGAGKWRVWSASRRWGLTMGRLHAAQARWAQQAGAAAGTEARDEPGLRPQAALDSNRDRYTSGRTGDGFGGFRDRNMALLTVRNREAGVM